MAIAGSLENVQMLMVKADGTLESRTCSAKASHHTVMAAIIALQNGETVYVPYGMYGRVNRRWQRLMLAPAIVSMGRYEWGKLATLLERLQDKPQFVGIDRRWAKRIREQSNEGLLGKRKRTLRGQQRNRWILRRTNRKSVRRSYASYQARPGLQRVAA